MKTDTSDAVVARGLGKLYAIGDGGPSGSLYDRLGSLVGRHKPVDPSPHDLWALSDIDFNLPRGRVLGVLGRNGSGKSTLMRILARVTSPTVGTAEVLGRVGALLQVGAGFHPELTGRDNIALSGAILGMSRSEILAVQDQVVDFAEIDMFLDTPVKHYSSGMYLRLAFSVSAHLAAEILLIDEVLSVGDAAFQEKCRRRIRELVADGRTVLFVSHSTSAVKSLCDSAIVLDGGRIQFAGDTARAIEVHEQLLGTSAAGQI